MTFPRHFGFTIVWALLILMLYLTSGKSLGVFDLSHLFHPDKLAHAGVFMILSTSLGISLFKHAKQIRLKNKSILNSFLICSLYGIILESCQVMIADRAFDLVDIVANQAGIVVGLVILKVIFKGLTS